MAILFFEGFNIRNTDLTPYLDPNYWSRPFDLNYPKLQYVEDGTSLEPHRYGTHGHLRISGYRLDSAPPEVATPLQLSGVSGLNSDKLYLSFRVQGLTHNDMYNNSFPFAAKFLTFCDGDTETLTFDVVRTSGLSIQGGSAQTSTYSSEQWAYANIGIGISVKQSGNEIGLFDLRLGDVSNYSIWDLTRVGWGAAHAPLGIIVQNPGNLSLNENRYIHLDFLINKTNNTINIKLEGFDILNRLTSPSSYSPDASGQTIGNINNIKFYNKGVSNNGSISSRGWANGTNGGDLTLDDLAIYNNSGNSPNIWMGPKTRIYLLHRGVGYVTTMADKDEWTRINGGGAIDSRDGDSSYLTADTSGLISSVRFHRTDMYGNSAYFSNGIGGIRIFNDVRKTFLDSSFVNVYGTGNLTNSNNFQEIGSKYIVTKNNYDIHNSFIFNNPETNTPWTSGTFLRLDTAFPYYAGYYYTSGSFGVKKL